VAALVDTNVLVYAHDPRFPGKQAVAERLLAAGAKAGNLALPHQALVEFVAATTRPRPAAAGQPRRPLLSTVDAARAVETFLAVFDVLYPDEEVVSTALRGAGTYGLSWYDAHLWAYAEVFGLPEILSEDFEHGRFYGAVRVIDPFRGADTVHEPPADYGRPISERVGHLEGRLELPAESDDTWRRELRERNWRP
jgi:predicted nucleic acid-binding protein